MKKPDPKKYVGRPMEYFNDVNILKKAQMMNSEQPIIFEGQESVEVTPDIRPATDWFSKLKSAANKITKSKGDDYLTTTKKKNK